MLLSVAEGVGGLAGWLWSEPSTSSPRARAHFWASSCSRGSMRKRHCRSVAGSQTLTVGQSRRKDQSVETGPAGPELKQPLRVPRRRAQPSSGAAASSSRSISVSA